MITTHAVDVKEREHGVTTSPSLNEAVEVLEASPGTVGYQVVVGEHAPLGSPVVPSSYAAPPRLRAD